MRGYVPEPRMKQRVFPQLRMTNWQRTRAFYVDGLGFSVDWELASRPVSLSSPRSLATVYRSS